MMKLKYFTAYCFVFISVAFMGCSVKKQSSPTLEEVTHDHVAKAIRQAIKESVDEEVKNRKNDISKLSQRQIQIEESLVENQEITDSQLDHARIDLTPEVEQTNKENLVTGQIEEMGNEGQLLNLSDTQIQSLKKEILEEIQKAFPKTVEEIQYASQEATEEIQQAVPQAVEEIQKASREATAEMETQFSEISLKEVQKIENIKKGFTEEITQKVVEEMKMAMQTTEATSNNKETQFIIFSDSEIKDIKEAIEPTVREVIDKVLPDIVEKEVSSQTYPAIENMELKYTETLRKGLQTIISVAIQTVSESLVMLPENVNEVSRQKSLDDTLGGNISHGTQLIFDAVGLQQSDVPSLFSNLAFEKCDWKNKDYTTRIIQDHTFFNFKDPFTSLVNRWEEFKKNNKDHQLSCSSSQAVESFGSQESQAICPQKSAIEEEFDYLSPLYNEFVLDFFKESIQEKQLSENDIPLECFFAGSVRGANLYTSAHNYYYCKEDAVHPSYMTVKDDEQNTRVIAPQRACLNRDYTFLTAKAFNKTADCFGFNKSDKELIFKLFNHESSFLHNVKSSKSARCYGQLTKIALEEINKQIYFSNSKNPFPYSFIFDEVIEQCPGLQTAVLNPEIYEQRNKKNMKHFESLVAKTAVNCKMTQNPYTCLFYAFYNIKINMVDIEKQLEGATSSFGRKNNIPEDFKNTFSLPILLSEMIGVTNIEGRNMVFWDDSEIWNVLRNKDMDQIESIRVLPLFSNEDEVKNIFNLWAYNGGISISGYMEDFIRQLKRSIARPCSPQETSKICQYRFAVQEGQGIATKDIKKDFQAYILRNYELKEGRKRRLEVKNFVHLVETHLNYLYDKNGLFKYHLKELVPELTNQDVEDFQDYLKDVCPEVDSSLI